MACHIAMSAFEAFETIFYDEIQIISGYDEHYKQKLRVCVADKWWNVISTWLSNAWKCRSLGLERQFEPGMQSPGNKSSCKTYVWSGNGCLDSCLLIYIK